MADRDIICSVETNAEDREVINRILSRAGYLVKEYADAAAFLNELAQIQAGCAIVEVRPPGIDVSSLASELARTRPDIPCIVTTVSKDVPLAVAAMKAGAVDFIEKPVDTESLVQVLRQAIDNRRPHGSGVARPLRPCLIDKLTRRERDVLDLLLQGYQNKNIAYELGISQRTVEVYRARLKRRLNASSFAELVRVAVEERFTSRNDEAAKLERH
jgi:two-component system response regulator FixJ